ncbi:MAG: Na+/H+ antiporter subunit C [Trueperaceae bacterium]|nr:Na+/H+ antiporter subunit C [Trueperaceae bacterium]
METILSVVVGGLFAGAVYLMLRRNLLKFIFGFVLMSNAVNLLIFTAGRLTRASAPIIPDTADAPTEIIANPLPQALILTAIVIGFGFIAFSLVLLYRSYQATGTVDTDKLRELQAALETTHQQPKGQGSQAEVSA